MKTTLKSFCQLDTHFSKALKRHSCLETLFRAGRRNSGSGSCRGPPRGSGTRDPQDHCTCTRHVHASWSRSRGRNPARTLRAPWSRPGGAGQDFPSEIRQVRSFPRICIRAERCHQQQLTGAHRRCSTELGRTTAVLLQKAEKSAASDHHACRCCGTTAPAGSHAPMEVTVGPVVAIGSKHLLMKLRNIPLRSMRKSGLRPASCRRQHGCKAPDTCP